MAKFESSFYLVRRNTFEKALIALFSVRFKLGFGRIAFATPSKHQEELNQKILASKEYKFKHHKIELGTPGKASVHVIILVSWPDQYEICFANDEDYSVLSKTDPNAKQELERELKKEAAKKA